MTLALDEQVNQVNALTSRVRKRKEEYLAARVHICSERSRLYTESWKQTEGEPIVIRKAKAFKNLLEGIPIAIHEGELIVGSQTNHVRGVHPDIETCFPDILRSELQVDQTIVQTTRTVGVLTEEDRQSILDDCDYWENKTAPVLAKDTFRRLWGDRWDDFRGVAINSEFLSSPAARIGDWGKVLNRGLNGIVSEAQQKISELKGFDKGELHALCLYEAMIISCKAVVTYAHRYADLARQMAAAERDETKKAELQRIAETCDWVPANPARTFYEALQSFFVCFLALNLETAGVAETPGRFDQYMYPLFKKDIDEGKITYQEAAELLGLLLVKCMAMGYYGLAGRRIRLQGNQFMNLTVGGVTEDGKDATNELTFLLLEVVRQVKSHQPHISLRYHDGMSEEFLIKAVECNRDHGAGIPAFFNDKPALVSLCQKGIPIREARNWGPQGCVERTIQPSSVLCTSGPFYNLAKMFEITLNNGVDPRTGIHVGLATGDPRQFSSFEELCDAFKRQVGWFVDAMIDMSNIWFIIRADNCPLPYNSALLNGCMESGEDVLAGGGRWGKKFLASLRPFGQQNTANSLAAIKKLVYEERKVTMGELLDALAADFVGREDLRQMLLAAPKWGNDDNYVDDIMRDLFMWTGEQVKQRTNPWGEPWVVSAHGLTLHFQFGIPTGALPDGRKAWTVLADGTVSAAQGTDTKGPTAVFNSAAKVDNIGFESTLLNLKFSPGPLQTRDGMRKFIAMIKTYFDNYGHHCQFNILRRETLLDAKAHPENYRDLLVRVAGFSVFFVELSPEVQDEIIARTEHAV